MSKKNIRVALIAQADEVKKFCQSVILEMKEVSLEVYHALPHFRHECHIHAFNGILMDMFTLITASTDDKEFFFSLEESFPIFLVRYSPDESGAVNRNGIIKFLHHDAFDQPPRFVRSFPRRDVTLPIHLWLDSSETPVPSQILNISLGGCFLLDPRGKARKDRPLYLVIDGIDDRTPIPCQTRWTKSWKENDHACLGVGAEFERLSLPQAAEIRNVIHGRPVTKPH